MAWPGKRVTSPAVKGRTRRSVAQAECGAHASFCLPHIYLLIVILLILGFRARKICFPSYFAFLFLLKSTFSVLKPSVSFILLPNSFINISKNSNSHL